MGNPISSYTLHLKGVTFYLFMCLKSRLPELNYADSHTPGNHNSKLPAVRCSIALVLLLPLFIFSCHW